MCAARASSLKQTVGLVVVSWMFCGLRVEVEVEVKLSIIAYSVG